MRIEAQWLHRQVEFSEEEICELSGFSATELRGLVDYGVLAPIDPGARTWTFSADRLVLARSAFRLRKDFGLDLEGLALMVSVLERVRELEGELRDLRARLPGGSS